MATDGGGGGGGGDDSNRCALNDAQKFCTRAYERLAKKYTCTVGSRWSRGACVCVCVQWRQHLRYTTLVGRAREGLEGAVADTVVVAVAAATMKAALRRRR